MTGTSFYTSVLRLGRLAQQGLKFQSVKHIRPSCFSSFGLQAKRWNSTQQNDSSIDCLEPKLQGIIEDNISPSTAQKEISDIKFNIPKEMLLPDGTPDYLRLTLTSNVYEVIKETPLTKGVVISESTGVPVYLKREDLTPVFSFKIRGAHNKMASLDKQSLKNGVIACSAGNHAQGVAYSARTLGVKATIVMPQNTPEIKWRNVKRLGANVLLHGANFDIAKAECARLAKEQNLEVIHPFDDPYVIAGQGTIGLEILHQIDLRKLDAIYCAVGGGGLIAGIATYVKRIAPHVKVIGVETFDADALKKSLKDKKRVTLKEVGLFADGTAVKLVGEETFRLVSKNIDDVVLVDKDEICAAIKDVFLDTRSVVEPSGAMAVAGMKRYVAKHKPKNPNAAQVCILSGANMDFDRLRFIAERADLGLNKEVFLSVTIPERPGSFEALHNIITPRSITEFSYRYDNDDYANIYTSFVVKDRATELPLILQQISEQNMVAEDISDNELAKTHARYLIGGKSSVSKERLYRLDFPERPGALCKFLRSIKEVCSISLFHYRNCGGDIASVLAGLRVFDGQVEKLHSVLEEIGYNWVDETNNPVYLRYLRK
ncbi:threonine ammonia-lyase Tda1 [Schizosaccharomyces pombe]|uniref:Threonine dehydratase, mitochondrial n=1 Tax=Schizosaccharomyces pombe (strain 972 / ATCC 24843) TaxID=284812 RepID=THDH_SCHPO|nr:putative threonine ammonia-lyase [Schizosaccharomyces pombe]O94634.1 RecName: Full=Threonine dehydratase, mitochondrial; AltName: Full=Threonine deaminase; Flags: Precursor [Schizosaccharomyces pombe 972h-]CAB37622.1 mitochondrial threonine ammonia-lyase (predicted) [Schizosaccharomyces pombe]|eukprot:NP_596641.1 putative threonine ammonia-lyase [Schizosaccharomyces pombe]